MRVAAVEALRKELIVDGLLRKVLVALPEPKHGDGGNKYCRPLLRSLAGIWRLAMISLGTDAKLTGGTCCGEGEGKRRAGGF